jgi:hypothetical protein
LDKVKIAQGKINEATDGMKSNLIQMSENVAITKEKLLPTTQELAMESRKFQKTAEELEKQTQSRSFWAMSPKCLLLIGGTGGIGVVLYFIISALFLR